MESHDAINNIKENTLTLFRKIFKLNEQPTIINPMSTKIFSIRLDKKYKTTCLVEGKNITPGIVSEKEEVNIVHINSTLDYHYIYHSDIKIKPINVSITVE